MTLVNSHLDSATHNPLALCTLAYLYLQIYRCMYVCMFVCLYRQPFAAKQCNYKVFGSESRFLAAATAADDEANVRLLNRHVGGVVIGALLSKHVYVCVCVCTEVLALALRLCFAICCSAYIYLYRYIFRYLWLCRCLLPFLVGGAVWVCAHKKCWWLGQ